MDYDSLRRELLARVPQLTDRWTDFNASDLGVVLLELFCGVGDMLAYYLDAQAAEAFLPTARQRQNVINLCKLISYRLDGPVAATTSLRFTLHTGRNGVQGPSGRRRHRIRDGGRHDDPKGTDKRRYGRASGRKQDRDLHGHGRTEPVVSPIGNGGRPWNHPDHHSGRRMDGGSSFPGERQRRSTFPD